MGVGAFSENGMFRPSANALTRNEYGWNKGEHFLPVASCKVNRIHEESYCKLEGVRKWGRKWKIERMTKD
jgi:hypothetical protein